MIFFSIQNHLNELYQVSPLKAVGITCMMMQKEEETKHKKINDVDIL